MMRRLQTRLLLTFVAIAMVALLLVVLFAMLGTRNQFEAYIVRDLFISLNQTAQLFRGAILTEDTAVLQNLTQEVANTYETLATVYDGNGLIVADTDPEMVGQVISGVPLPVTGLGLRLIAEDGRIKTAHFFSDAEDSGEASIILLEDLSGEISVAEMSAESTDPHLIVRGEWIDDGQGGLVVNGDVTQPFTVSVNTGAPVMPPDFLIDTAASQQTFWTLVNRSFVWAGVASILAAIVLSWITSRRIVRPVHELTVAAQNMGQGNLDTRVVIKGEDELANLGHSFNQMASDLARQEDLRRHLVTDVAHELLTPLTTVRGQLEAIQDGVLAPEPAIINSLHEEVMLLDSLIADLQDLSLAEAGQLRLDLQETAVADIVESAVTAVQPQASLKEVTMVVDMPHAVPLIPMDTRRMGQVLRNLLVNAIIHSKSGGKIVVSVQLQETMVQINVQDSGSGIAPKDLPHVFDRFYRADRSRARSTGGSGLGLAIVKGIVEAHNGRVLVQSQLETGTVFSLTLPVVSSI